MNTDTYELITSKILERLEAGVIPWKHYSNLRSEQSAPRNLVSGRQYHGANYFLLSMMGYRSPWWLTFMQAKNLGGCVRKGEKSTPIIYWNLVERTDKETGEVESIPFLKYFSVFNSEQVDGIDARFPELPKTRATTANQEADRIVENMPNRPMIVYGTFPVASYSPSDDTVRMTKAELCVSDDRFHEVRFHEIGHASGSQNRLNRQINNVFGSPDYAREELCAECIAAFLCSECGISQATIDDSASYIDSWIRQLKGNPKLFVQAAGKAAKGADYILGRTEQAKVELPLAA
jgi:antirestriction protein ArdC